MSPIKTVLPASGDDTIKIKAYTRTMFFLKIVLPLAPDETK
jgi:hypothetical protein